MHPHRFDFTQSLQGAFQFAFQRPLIVHFFGKVRSRPVGRIEEFEAQAGIAGQSLRRRLQTAGIELVGGHQQAAAVRRKLVRDIFRRQTAAQRLRIFRLQAGVQGYVLGLSNQPDEPPEREPYQDGATGEQPFAALGSARAAVVRPGSPPAQRFGCFHALLPATRWAAQNCMREIS